MHPKAKAWDEEHVGSHGVHRKQATTMRPCDWCGEPLERVGIHIHQFCVVLERIHLLNHVTNRKKAQIDGTSTTL